MPHPLYTQTRAWLLRSRAAGIQEQLRAAGRPAPPIEDLMHAIAGQVRRRVNAQTAPGLTGRRFPWGVPDLVIEEESMDAYGGEPPEPVAVELSLRRAARRRFALSGTLRSPDLGERSVSGLWCWPESLELELGDRWSFVGNPESTAPSLLGRSLWTGPLTQGGEPRGSLRLRFDFRHDWPAVLRSLRL